MTQQPRASLHMEALKRVTALRQAREAALVVFCRAERALHDAEEEMAAIRLLAPRYNNRYSK